MCVCVCVCVCVSVCVSVCVESTDAKTTLCTRIPGDLFPLLRPSLTSHQGVLRKTRVNKEATSDWKQTRCIVNCLRFSF